MDQWAKILSSAVVVSAIAYLIRFFGSVISDQNPYTDDRKWAVEISGVTFFANIILSWGIIGWVLGFYFGIKGGVWIYFLIMLFAGILQLLLMFSSATLAKKIYKKEFFPKSNSSKELNNSYELFLSIARNIPLWLIPVIFGYMLTSVYFTGSSVWFLIFTVQAFVCLIYVAFIFSLRKLSKLPAVNIFMLNKQEPFLNVDLLKYNEDNVRFLQNGNPIIINRINVSKIVFLDPGDK